MKQQHTGLYDDDNLYRKKKKKKILVFCDCFVDDRSLANRSTKRKRNISQYKSVRHDRILNVFSTMRLSQMQW
jgi:hypothetical protein